jgi:hypothetical protein
MERAPITAFRVHSCAIRNANLRWRGDEGAAAAQPTACAVIGENMHHMAVAMREVEKALVGAPGHAIVQLALIGCAPKALCCRIGKEARWLRRLGARVARIEHRANPEAAMAVAGTFVEAVQGWIERGRRDLGQAATRKIEPEQPAAKGDQRAAPIPVECEAPDVVRQGPMAGCFAVSASTSVARVSSARWRRFMASSGH